MIRRRLDSKRETRYRLDQLDDSQKARFEERVSEAETDLMIRRRLDSKRETRYRLDRLDDSEKARDRLDDSQNAYSKKAEEVEGRD
jgi:hypothetical protein